MAARLQPPQLPYLAWSRIAHYCSESLETLLKLSSIDPALQGICRPYSSAFFRRAARPITETYFFHSLIQLVLRGDVDPAWIDEVVCHIHDLPPPFAPSPTSRPGLNQATESQVRRYDSLFEEAARASSYIDSGQEHEVCRRYRYGDEDAALVVLLPLCTKLKTVDPPVKGGLCAALFQSIAHQYQQRGVDAQQCQQFASEMARLDLDNEGRGRLVVKLSSPHGLPLSELLVIRFYQNVYYHNHPLIEMIPFFGIPSLQRIIVGAARERELGYGGLGTFPGWPEYIAPCVCPEIYFEHSSVSREVIRAFARGLPGPCEIRQWYETDGEGWGGSDNYDPPDWDFVKIETVEGGEKRVSLTLKWEGGNPGYEYPWVSWLWHGKMAGWRRLDEEFSVEEGDAQEMELSGMFGGI